MDFTSKQRKSLFISEIEELENKYNYKLKATLNATQEGIFPTILAIDTLPPQEEEKPKKAKKK